MKINKSVLLVALLGLLVIAGYIFFFNNKPVQKQNESTLQTTEKVYEEVTADLNGDGNQETLRLSINSNEKEYSVSSLVALDKKGKELGRLPESMPIPVPMSKSGKAHSPLSKNKIQFVSFDFVIGPHSSETMFFGLQDQLGQVLPVCLTDNIIGAESCVFWSGETGELVVEDLDNDGKIEVIELVDEYPKDGVLSKEEEDAVNKVFKDSEKSIYEGMMRIPKREKGGRGNKVVWGIYQFNGSIFEEQVGKSFDRLYDLVIKYLKTSYTDYPTIMKKSQLSKSSLDYNLFVRNFWTRR